MIRTALVLAILASSTLLSPGIAAENGLRVEGAYVPAPPPSVDVAAGYLSVENTSARAVAIVGVAGPCAPAIALHRSVMEYGIARMEAVPRVEIAPGEVVAFSPGGLHLMFRGASLTPGDVCRFSLVLGDGAQLMVSAPVRERVPRMHAHD